MPDTPSALTERIGVTAVQQIIHIEFGWFFREQTVSDHGVDAQIEELDQEGKPTGKLIALQIKTGASYFRKQGDDYVFYGKQRHLDYWSNHSLPCYIILHNPENGMTLWQKVERRLAIITDKGWSIPIPASNVLNKDAKQYFERELASDPEAIRRFNIAFDLDRMKKLADREVYFEVNDWVNKSLNIRDVGVMFDETDKDPPDFMVRIWTPAESLFDFMSRYFPWLDYEYLEGIEALGGEVEVHSLRVWLNDLGKQYLAVESYFANGAPERDEPHTPDWGRTEFDPDWEAFSDDEKER